MTLFDRNQSYSDDKWFGFPGREEKCLTLISFNWHCISIHNWSCCDGHIEDCRFDSSEEDLPVTANWSEHDRICDKKNPNNMLIYVLSNYYETEMTQVSNHATWTFLTGWVLDGLRACHFKMRNQFRHSSVAQAPVDNWNAHLRSKQKRLTERLISLSESSLTHTHSHTDKQGHTEHKYQEHQRFLFQKHFSEQEPANSFRLNGKQCYSLCLYCCNLTDENGLKVGSAMARFDAFLFSCPMNSMLCDFSEQCEDHGLDVCDGHEFLFFWEYWNVCDTFQLK